MILEQSRDLRMYQKTLSKNNDGEDTLSHGAKRSSLQEDA
jgi:hypothetical protein